MRKVAHRPSAVRHVVADAEAFVGLVRRVGPSRKTALPFPCLAGLACALASAVRNGQLTLGRLGGRLLTCGFLIESCKALYFCAWFVRFRFFLCVFALAEAPPPGGFCSCSRLGLATRSTIWNGAIPGAVTE